MKVYGVIPARLESTRLPGKLLLNETGKPLIQHTWEAARRCPAFVDVIIATDSPQIAEAVEAFGGRCELTGDHTCGTDRVAEVVARCCADADAIVNVQGDEPELEPAHLDRLVQALEDAGHADMATLAAPITRREVLEDPGCVKVVCDRSGRAMYFSRSPVPYCRDGNVEDLLKNDSPWLLHVGTYAYRREFLLQICRTAPSPLERLEKLEQLRALEHGATIQVAVVEHAAVGIDTAEDYRVFVERWLAQEHRFAA